MSATATETRRQPHGARAREVTVPHWPIRELHPNDPDRRLPPPPEPVQIDNGYDSARRVGLGFFALVVLVVIALIALSDVDFTSDNEATAPSNETPAQMQDASEPNSGTVQDAVARTYDPAFDHTIAIRDASGDVQICPRVDAPIVPYLFVHSNGRLYPSVDMPQACWLYLGELLPDMQMPEYLN